MSFVRASILSFTLVTITAFGTQAQSFHIGLKAEGNFLKLSGRSFNGKTQAGYSAGAFGELNFTRQFGIQPELMFTQTFATTGDEFTQIYPGSVSSNFTLNYITVPVLFSYRPIPELSILVGPQYAYLVNQTEGLLQGSQYPKDAFKTSDLAIVFGGQLNLGKFKMGARYQAGVMNINGINNGDTWKINGFQLYLGFRIL